MFSRISRLPLCRNPLPRLAGRLVPFGLILFVSSVLHAQPFEARGRVLGIEGEVPRETRVELWRAIPAIERDRADLGERPALEPDERVPLEADGSFQVLAADPGPWVLRVSAPGRIPIEHSPFLLRDLRVLDTAILLPAEGFEVAVHDLAGRPVAGAWVEVRPAKLWRQHEERSFSPLRRRAVTGEDGRARLFRAAGEEVKVRAFRPGGPESEELQISGELPDESLRLVLPHAVPRPLLVRDAEGRPAQGFAIRVGEWSWPAALTDEEGKAEVALGARASRVVIANPAGWTLELPLGAGPAGDPVEIFLPPPVEITGTVLDRRTLDPVPGAWVWRGESLEDGLDTVVTTDRAGRFRLEAEPVRKVRLLAVAVGYQPWWWERPVEGGEVKVAIALPPALLVQGRVVDPAGQAIAEADVRVRQASRRRQSWKPGRRVLQVSTGPEGRFRIPAEAAEVFDIRAEARGFAPTELRRTEVELVEPFDIELRRGAAVTGRAVDLDGAPLPGVAVRLFEELDRAGAWAARDDRVLARETVTGDDGRFLARHLAPGAYDLELRLEGMAPRLLPGVEPPEEIENEGALDLGDVVLEPGAALEGRVVDPEGMPIPEAEVRVGAFVPGLQNHIVLPPGLDDRDARSDADGRFRFEDLLPGEPVTVTAQASGFVPGAAPGVAPPTEEPVEIRLEPGVRLFGRVVGPGGEGIAGARVRAVVQRETPRHNGRYTSVRSDPEGSFEFDTLHRGEALLEVTARGFVPATVKGLSTLSGRDVGPVVVRLDAGASVTGRVLDPTGSPLAGVRINARYWRDDEERSKWVFRGWATSGVGGRFEVAGLPLGKVQLQALQGDLEALREIELRPGGGEVDLVLEPARGVFGRVVDPEGRPVAGAQVGLRAPNEYGARGYTATDLMGRFRLEPEPGEYLLEVMAEGFAHSAPEPLVVGEEPIRGLEIRLRTGASVYGRITGVELEDLPRVEIHMVTRSGREFVQGRPGFDGGYRIRGLGSGVWTVSAQIDGHSIRSTVEITDEESSVNVDLHFPEGLTLTGRVLRNGDPVVNASIGLAPAERIGTSHNATSTGHDGRFRLRGLEPGTYRLMVNDRATGWRTVREVEVWSDEEIQVEGWATRVTGHLVDSLGEPVANVQVKLRPLTGQGADVFLPFEIRSRPDGRFVLPAVDEGAWRLTAEADERGTLITEIAVSGAEMDLGTLVLETGAALWLAPRLESGGVPPRISVVVLTPDTGQPVVQETLTVEADGRARLTTVPPGSWRLVVFVEGMLPVVLPVDGASVSDETIPVLLRPSTELLVEVPELVEAGATGRVILRDSRGQPFDFFGLPSFDVDVANGWPLPGGRLNVPILPAGVWSVEVTAEDGRVWSGTVATQPGQPAKLVLE